MRIMIVDDNAEMRTFVRSLLADLADTIEDYALGSVALDRLSQELPDWIIVDLVMPGVDGLAVTSWVKTHCPAVRVAVMTQHANPELRNLAFETGASAFIPKEDLLDLRSLVQSEPASSKSVIP